MNKLLLFLLFVLFWNTPIVFSQCFANGPRNATIFSNNASIGTVSWVTPPNVKVSDNQRSNSSSFVNSYSIVSSNYLVETGLGFAVPVTATICGIQVDAERRQQGAGTGCSVKDNSVKIVKNGVITGTEHASTLVYPGLDIYGSYGGPNDLWGTTWTPSDINATNFGVAYSTCLKTDAVGIFMSAEIDHMQITVFYKVNILPIELIEFQPSCQSNNKIQLEWSVASQLNNDYFKIERSSDGLIFEEAGMIDGAGTTDELKHYSFIDVKPYQGLSYYKLTQTDFNGQSKSFEIVSVNCNLDYGQISPNPSSGKFAIDGKGDLEIYNLVGERIYYMKNIFGKTQIDLQNTPNGVYFYHLTSANEIIGSGKMLIQ